MQPKFRGIFASSTDPSGQTLSLTVESFSKVIIGLVGWFAVSKGLDPAGATTQAQAIIDLIAQAIPVGFTLYHTLLTVWGLLRKLFVSFATTPTAPPAA